MKKGVVDWWASVNIFTGSIARSAKRRYLSKTEADFEVFRRTGATRCIDGAEIANWLQKMQPEMEICNRK